jgi:hypothetical protein
VARPITIFSSLKAYKVLEMSVPSLPTYHFWNEITSKEKGVHLNFTCPSRQAGKICLTLVLQIKGRSWLHNWIDTSKNIFWAYFQRAVFCFPKITVA